MEIQILSNRQELGIAAARRAADEIRSSIEAKGEARIVVATGASQFEVLEHLCNAHSIDWACVDAFHLDEYIGLDDQHPASFCRYLRERFASRVPLRSMHFLSGVNNPDEVCRLAGIAIQHSPIDVALIGIGENGHLAFNDPPADFTTLEPYCVVELDQACREQQVGEGWFASLDEVPKRAISMSVQQILASKTIICSVPDMRKSIAVAAALEGQVTPMVPASILQQHANTYLFCDIDSASKLSQTNKSNVSEITN